MATTVEALEQKLTEAREHLEYMERNGSLKQKVAAQERYYEVAEALEVLKGLVRVRDGIGEALADMTGRGMQLRYGDGPATMFSVGNGSVYGGFKVGDKVTNWSWGPGPAPVKLL